MNKNETDARELKLRALELRILGGALKQTLDGTCSKHQCDAVDGGTLAGHARAIAEEAPSETTDPSYVLHLQSQLCLALSSLQGQLFTPRRSGAPDTIQQPPQNIFLEQGRNEARNRDESIETDDFVARDEIASLQDDLARTKARMDSALCNSRSSRASLADISTPDEQEDDTDSVSSEQMGSIASIQFDLVFTKETLSDKRSFARIPNRILTDSTAIMNEDDGTNEEQIVSMASFHIDLAIAREEFGDAQSFSLSSRSLPDFSVHHNDDEVNEPRSQVIDASAIDEGSAHLEQGINAVDEHEGQRSSAGSRQQKVTGYSDRTPITHSLRRTSFTGKTA